MFSTDLLQSIIKNIEKEQEGISKEDMDELVKLKENTQAMSV